MVGQSPGRARALAAPSPHSNHHAPCNDPSPRHPFPSVRRVARAHPATPARRAAAPARPPAGIERLREPCSGCRDRVLARRPAPRSGLRQDLERRCGALAARPDHRRHRCGDLRLPGQRHDVDPGDERGAGVDRGIRHPELDERVRGHRRPGRLLERGRRHLVDTVVDRTAEPRRARARLRSRRDRRRDQRRSGAEPERDSSGTTAAWTGTRSRRSPSPPTTRSSPSSPEPTAGTSPRDTSSAARAAGAGGRSCNPGCRRERSSRRSPPVRSTPPCRSDPSSWPPRRAPIAAGMAASPGRRRPASPRARRSRRRCSARSTQRSSMRARTPGGAAGVTSTDPPTAG